MLPSYEVSLAYNCVTVKHHQLQDVAVWPSILKIIVSVSEVMQVHHSLPLRHLFILTMIQSTSFQRHKFCFPADGCKSGWNCTWEVKQNLNKYV